MRRTRVKICGITNAADAFAAVEAGADALGFVFAESPRKVDAAAVRAITRQLPPLVTTVGVFVNAALDDLHKTMTAAGLMVAQLHGEESADYVRTVRYPVLKRILVTIDDDFFEFQERLARFSTLDFLFDPGAGSGVPMNLDRIPFGGDELPRIYLAGGLNPENVGDAIRRKRPFAVDVSSGVEASLGRKDPVKLRRFIDAVRTADAELHCA